MGIRGEASASVPRGGGAPRALRCMLARGSWSAALFLAGVDALYCRFLPAVFLACGSGGTGRRASLRSLWPQGRGGSNPLFRTSLIGALPRTPAPFVPLAIQLAPLRSRLDGLRARAGRGAAAPCAPLRDGALPRTLAFARYASAEPAEATAAFNGREGGRLPSLARRRSSLRASFEWRAPPHPARLAAFRSRFVARSPLFARGRGTRRAAA